MGDQNNDALAMAVVAFMAVMSCLSPIECEESFCAIDAANISDINKGCSKIGDVFAKRLSKICEAVIKWKSGCLAYSDMRQIAFLETTDQFWKMADDDSNGVFGTVVRRMFPDYFDEEESENDETNSGL